jgi:hypothetical protein
MNDPEITLENLLTRPENLYWAWKKFQRNIRYGNFLYDEIEVAQFEANLKQEFDRIIKQFKSLTYQMGAIRPLPHPKKPDDNGDVQARQSFWIPVRDQVAWIAFVNIVGPWLEEKMPPWSYGNRLYRSVWIDETEDDKHYVKLGWFRHTAGHIYRKFKQSWPVYRRHIFLTAKAMAKVLDPDDLDEPELRVLKAEKYFSARDKLPYLKAGYWGRNSIKRDNLYWAGIDFKKFFPSIRLNCVKSNLSTFSDHFPKEIIKLSRHLMRFPLDLRDYDEKELGYLDLPIDKKVFKGIPTGLPVAGFLANVALLEVDKKVAERLKEQQNSEKPVIAHFRYVDDHIFISRDFDALIEWINGYKAIIEECKTGASIKNEKTEPKDVAPCLFLHDDKIEKDKEKKARKACLLDAQYPSPLMTKTLGLVSNLAHIEFDLLQQPERTNLINEFEHLLLAEFPDREIRADTRMSFAATRLSWYGPRIVRPDRANLCVLEREMAQILRDKKEISEKIRHQRKTSKIRLKLEKELALLSDRKAHLKDHRQKMLNKIERNSERDRKRIFHLLMKAVHDYPDKLVLWNRVLQFCRYSGHEDLEKIHEEIHLSEKKFPLTAAYIRALLQQFVATQVMRCAADISNIKLSIHIRNTALSYLNGVLRSSFVLSPVKGDKFFEKRSDQIFQCALGSANLILKQMETDEIVTKEIKQKLAGYIKKRVSTSWTRAGKRWSKETAYPLAVWTWWAEKKLQGKIGVNPGQIWLKMAKKLDIKDHFAWHVWSIYPAHLLKTVGPKLFVEDSFEGNEYLKKGNEGWLYEVLSEKTKIVSNLIKKRGTCDTANNVISIIDSKKFSLDKWVAWTNRKFQRNLFDPRVSEWTSMAIIDQVLYLIEDQKQIQSNFRYQLHPANISVPVQWKKPKSAALTWERWHKELKNTSIKIRKTKKLVHDPRFNPSASVQSVSEKELVEIRAVGMLLLGLISRTFTWPIPWNFIGHEMAGVAFGHAKKQEVPCSSWTTAILEACLLPRPRETFFLDNSLQETPDDDTTLDPPKISSIEKLHDYVKKAKDVLERNQITVQNHMPRQLIPVKLQQLTRPNWSEDFEH